MAEAPLYPATGQPMLRDTRPLEIRYRGRSAVVDMPGWYSEASGESIHSRDDMTVSDRALTSLKAASRNLAGPDEVRDIRSRLGLSQAEADRLIEDEPGAFALYESGRRLATRSLTHLLRLLARHPDELGPLRANFAQSAPESGVHASSQGGPALALEGDLFPKPASARANRNRVKKHG